MFYYWGLIKKAKIFTLFQIKNLEPMRHTKMDIIQIWGVT